MHDRWRLTWDHVRQCQRQPGHRAAVNLTVNSGLQLTVNSANWAAAAAQFLYWHNAADLTLLKNIKQAFDPRVSVCHTATVIANAFMLSGTTVDTFLRDNLDWLARATNWAKFGATASLGVIHRGHLQQVRPP